MVTIPVGQRSGGRLATTLVAPKKDVIFILFSHRLLFSQKERSDQKNYLEKVDRSAPKPWGIPLSRPQRLFWRPLAAILDF